MSVNDTFTLFQFLIVRLKELVSVRFKRYILISIPYSSIKRGLLKSGAKYVAFISIPYSSIKRFTKNYGYINTNEFQFLIVRLKGNDIGKELRAMRDFNSL